MIYILVNVRKRKHKSYMQLVIGWFSLVSGEENVKWKKANGKWLLVLAFIHLPSAL